MDAGMARHLSVMVRIGEWWGDQYADVLLAVPPQTDPSTPPTGWKFDFPIREEPPEHLLGEAAHLTCFYLEEGGGRGTAESEGFRLERADDDRVRFKAWG